MRSKCIAFLFVLAGCPDVTENNNEAAVPYVEFDPTNSIIPYPDNLLIDPLTGLVSIPAQACESPAQTQLRTQVLNTLNGFGTFEVALQATMTASVDPSTLAGNVFLYKRLAGTTPIAAASATAVPITVTPSQTLRYDASNCTLPATVSSLTIIPQVPLDPDSTYTVAILSGAMTSSSTIFYPSFVWSLVRQSEDPVTVEAGCTPTPTSTCAITNDATPIAPSAANLAELNGIAFLWNAHEPALTFLDQLNKTEPNRSNVLLAWDFTTQTTTSPLDPSVAGSPASALGTTPLLETFSVASELTTECGGSCACTAGSGCTAFFNLELGAGICTELPCTAVGDVLGAGLISSNYQTSLPNAADASAPIPGPWTDPYNPQLQANVPLDVLAFIPNGTAPVAGWPTVVFGHGLGGSKEELFAVAGQLAAEGFASVAIDFQDSGSRAVPTSNAASLGCAGACSTTTTQACDAISNTCTAIGQTCIGGAGEISPTTTQQCYASILTTDLATTRDNIRQTVLDLQRLVNAAKACGAASCTSSNNASVLSIDPDNIVYMGISLGGIIGTTTNAVETNFKAGVLDVAAVGLLDILENTDTLDIVCPLVNALITDGVLVGTQWNPAMPTVGLCTTSAWKTQPSYQQFASAARWVLDPADGANFVTPHGSFAGLVSKKFLLMEVINDQVVPNIATMDEGLLLGQTAMTADVYNPLASETNPSVAITTNITTNKWVQYPTLAPDLTASPAFYGNSFQHASLLEPVAGFCSVTTTQACGATGDPACPGSEICDTEAGVFGTARVQTDAITYLVGNR